MANNTEELNDFTAGSFDSGAWLAEQLFQETDQANTSNTNQCEYFLALSNFSKPYRNNF
jgi:hypothetical protein